MSTSEDTNKESETARGRTVSWPPYHWIDQPIEPILNNFWEATYKQKDLENYQRLIRMLSLRKQGMSNSDIHKTLSVNNVGKYLSGDKQSFVTHLRAEHDRLGAPSKGCKWLPLRLKPRGTPDEDWIQVPTEIRDFNDISSVIEQVAPTEESYSLMEQFGYRSRDELNKDRTNLFGFYAGFMLGDAGKGLRCESRFPSMVVSTMLSKAKPNSERFGEFASFSVNASLGFQSHRIRDAPPSEHRYTKAGCFRWMTPVSPLFAWVFRVTMGLKRGERTTYDPLRAEWLLKSPPSFRVHFLQGLAESDGWVNPGSDSVMIVASPNEQLVGTLLRDLEIPHKFDHQKVNVVVFGTTEGLKLPIFNERIPSFYYDNLLIMANAKRFPERSPLPSWFLSEIEPILSNCSNYDQACLEIARKTGYKISNNTVKKYVKARS